MGILAPANSTPPRQQTPAPVFGRRAVFGVAVGVVAILLGSVATVQAQLELVAPIVIDTNQTADATAAAAIAETPAPTPEPTRLKKKPKSKFIFGDPKAKKEKKKKKLASATGSAVNDDDGKPRSSTASTSKAKNDKGKGLGSGFGGGSALKPLSNPHSITKGMLGSAFKGFHGKRHNDDGD